MTDELSAFTSVLPADLLKRAFRAGNELAWARADAIKAIDLLQRRGEDVIGVDVWVPSAHGPIVSGRFVYDWSAPGEDSVKDWPRSPTEFVRTFEWDPKDIECKDREPFFNLTVAKNRG